ncbi:AEC family transporter [Pectinatus frisingensis]|uniref:AEC family transporter n=1 Tax=Pectinatus frisingensis TaxID=865 RepID=UPI0015F73505|nr:AEC family transporter [Pectinatus frisingensis]
MNSNFVIAVEAVIPLFCLMFIGIMVKKYHLLSSIELVHLNKMVFEVFFSIMMFYNIYTTDLASTLRPKLMIFGAAALFVIYIAAFSLVCFFEKDNRRRGAMIQAIFRSNFVLMGIPLVSNIFGDDAIAVPTMMIAIIVPLYNILGVFTLETFRGRKFAFWPIFIQVLKNPMIVGALLGAACLLIGLPIPKPILKPLGQITAATSPLALIILGASFEFGSSRKNKLQLGICVISRLLIVPAVVLTAAVLLGFRGIELVTLISIFCTPCAVASFAMAQQMDSDADLAGNCVVFTSLLSCFTIFFWILLFKELGMF